MPIQQWEIHSQPGLLGEGLGPALDEMTDNGHPMEGLILPGEMRGFWGDWWEGIGGGEGKEEGPGIDLWSNLVSKLNLI